MSEKRFLSFVLIEGVILTILGLCILILPKLTALSFGVMLSFAFISYGIYKIMNAFFNKNYAVSFLMEATLGLFAVIIGILLLLVSRVNLLWLIVFIGIYFLLESISTSAFLFGIRHRYNFWGGKLFSSIFLLFVSLLIILGVPAINFWVVAMLSGLAFLIKGISKISLFNANRNIENFR